MRCSRSVIDDPLAGRLGCSNNRNTSQPSVDRGWRTVRHRCRLLRARDVGRNTHRTVLTKVRVKLPDAADHGEVAELLGDAAVRPEDVTVRVPLDWDSVDPIPEALAEVMRRPGSVDVSLDDVAPGEPEPAHAEIRG